MTSTDGTIKALYVNLRGNVKVVTLRQIDKHTNHYTVYKPLHMIDAVVHVLKAFSEEDPGFTTKVVEVDELCYKTSSHRTRRYVHTDPSRLYGKGREEFQKKHARKVGGIWFDSNLNKSCMFSLISEACEAAQVPIGKIRDIEW